MKCCLKISGASFNGRNGMSFLFNDRLTDKTSETCWYGALIIITLDSKEISTRLTSIHGDDVSYVGDLLLGKKHLPDEFQMNENHGSCFIEKDTESELIECLNKAILTFNDGDRQDLVELVQSMINYLKKFETKQKQIINLQHQVAELQQQLTVLRSQLQQVSDQQTGPSAHRNERSTTISDNSSKLFSNSPHRGCSTGVVSNEPQLTPRP